MTQSAIDQVQVYKDEYMLDDTTGNKVGNAAALYKVIMRCTTLDTLSTNKALFVTRSRIYLTLQPPSTVILMLQDQGFT